MNGFTVSVARSFFDGTTWARGATYAGEGRVADILGGADGRSFVAMVRGSGGRVYRVTLRLPDDGRGGTAVVLGECTCTVGLNCKHAAALCHVLLPRGGFGSPAVVQRVAGSPSGATTRLPPAVTVWLDRLRLARRETAEDADGWPDHVRDRLLYVIDPEASGEPSVDVLKGRLSKMGALAPNPSRYDITVHLQSPTPPKFISRSDHRLAGRLLSLGLLARSYYSTRRDIDGEAFTLLEAIIGTGRAYFRDAAGPALRKAAERRGKLCWAPLPDGGQRLVLQDESGRRLHPLAMKPPAYVDPESGEFGVLSLHAPLSLIPLLTSAPEIPPEHAEVLADRLEALRLPGMPPLAVVGSSHRVGRDPEIRLSLFSSPAVPFGQNGARGRTTAVATLRLAFIYDGRPAGGPPGGQIRFREGDQAVVLLRDEAAERRAFDRLAEAGALPEAEIPWRLTPPGEAADLYFATAEDGASSTDALRFMARVLPELVAEGWRVETAPDWPLALFEGDTSILGGVTEADGKEASRVLLHLQAGDGMVDLLPVVCRLLEHLSRLDPEAPDLDRQLDDFLATVDFFPRLGDGRFVDMDARALAPVLRVFLSASGLLDGFHRADSARLFEAVEALQGSGIAFEGGPALLDLGRKLHALGSSVAAAPPTGFRATLRPYQAAGFGWLRALEETGFGGVLADDMGLGKTVQTLALLAHRHLAELPAEHPSLLVVPTSLVHSWQRQAEQFAPGLRVLALRGAGRKADFETIGDHHLVITTYALLHRDREVLMKRPWTMAILDEAQAVKNPASAGAKAIRELDARWRLALTGTPLENSLTDLWTLFDWLIPGLLGNRRAFAARFGTPIEKQRDRRAQAELNARVRPFLLRRTKPQVAADLPDKVEITESVPLGPRQAALYEAVRAAMDERVRRAIAEKGLAASRITILDALLKLRQICCDPTLLKHESARAVAESAKRERLRELLSDLMAEGRRVLVFSQFVEMLRLIETDARAAGWPYTWLTGDTVDREAAVDRFQSGAVPLFLISLKAGGVGLTLTAADTVILYDPWWNPAVERQAMDRAHRIGQTSKVFVYRLITEGSVEQAISELQARKQALADALLDDGASPLGLEESEITALFRPLSS